MALSTSRTRARLRTLVFLIQSTTSTTSSQDHLLQQQRTLSSFLLTHLVYFLQYLSSLQNRLSTTSSLASQLSLQVQSVASQSLLQHSLLASVRLSLSCTQLSTLRNS